VTQFTGGAAAYRLLIDTRPEIFQCAIASVPMVQLCQLILCNSVIFLQSKKDVNKKWALCHVIAPIRSKDVNKMSTVQRALIKYKERRAAKSGRLSLICCESGGNKSCQHKDHPGMKSRLGHGNTQKEQQRLFFPALTESARQKRPSHGYSHFLRGWGLHA
jgi:hypothetical protein